MTDKPKPDVTVEFRLENALYRIEGEDLQSLNAGLRLAQSFDKKYAKTLVKHSNSKASISTNVVLSQPIDCKLPEWFYGAKAKVADVIALVLYYSNRPLTNGEITEIVAKEWRPVHLQNISKNLTTKGKHLYPYVIKEPKTRAFHLKGEGKKWVVSTVMPNLQKPKKESAGSKG